MMKIKKLTVKGIVIPIVILLVLGAAFIFVRSTLAAEITAIDCHGKIVVTKAIQWNNATSYDSKVFTICIKGIFYPESCKNITAKQVNDGAKLTWDYIPAGTYTVYEKDPGLEWSVTGGGDVTISYEGQVAETTITNSIVALDYGDLPEDYGLTLLGEDGPRHKVGNLYLGGDPPEGVTEEDDGQPSITAEGDDKDDGVYPQGNWKNGVGQSLQVVVTGGEGCLFGWLDYKNGPEGYNNNFEEDETLLYNHKVTPGLNTINSTEFENIPAVSENSLTFARFRLLPPINGECNYGEGSTDLDMLTGAYENGEVEDYNWIFGPDAVSIAAFSASPVDSPPYLIVGVILLTLTSLSLLTWRRLRTVGVSS